MISEMLSGRHDHALARHDLDQPFQLQPLQRLVHGRPADLQQTGYGRLVEILAGQEIERDDLLLDVLVGLGDQGAVLDRRLPDRVVLAHGRWRAMPQAGASLQSCRRRAFLAIRTWTPLQFRLQCRAGAGGSHGAIIRSPAPTSA